MADERRSVSLSQETVFLIAWSVAFGVALAFGGSALDLFNIQFLGVTAASPFVALMITLNKLVVFRPLSVTLMYAVASVIAIFTPYLGPPSILKPIFVLAALSFDAATLFRTRELRFWNLVAGHLAVTITGFAAYWIILTVMVPGFSMTLAALLAGTGPVYFALSVAVAGVVYRFAPPKNPPEIVARIRSSVSPSTPGERKVSQISSSTGSDK